MGIDKMKNSYNSKILNIVVCYENENEILEYIKKLELQDSFDKIDLGIVVNKYGQYTKEEFNHAVNKTNLNVNIIEPSKNLGYINGFLYGFNSYLGTNMLYKYIILSNTDIDFIDSTFYNTLLTRSYDERVWCIGPSIYSTKTKSFQNPVCSNKRPKWKIQLLSIIFSLRIIGKMYYKYATKKSKINNEHRGSKNTYEVHGSYIILKPLLVKELVKEKFEAFMFSEESFIAEIVLKNNKIVYYDSELKIIHNEHSVTGQIVSAKKIQMYSESLKFILKRFY